MLHSGFGVLAVLLLVTCIYAAPIAPYPNANTVILAKSRIAAAPPVIPTGLTKNDYIQTISGITGFFRTQLQNAAGIIIDPYTGPREVQYATPTFGYAAIVQGIVTRDDVILTSGIKALNASLQNLIDNKCADSHCNFFTMPLMVSIEAIKPIVSSSLYAFYLSQASKIKTSSYINNDINWGIVAASGDYIRYLLGQTNTAFFEQIFAQHLKFFSLDGMYQDATPTTNPSTTYDIFPRLYLEYCLLRGYNGSSASNLTEYLERGALSSLLLQSPIGENPTGGRSSMHQWNEAVLTVIFELRANKYKAAGDMVMASAFKRGARLALQSFRRWFHKDGYVYVVKNHFHPSLRFGYEIYSHLTQYNGLPASFLALAYTLADDTIPEGPSFAETGGYAMEVPAHRKIVANVKGNYYEWETQADRDYDSTGLTRVHRIGTWTLGGPTAATAISAGALNIGIGWTKGGISEKLAEFNTSRLTQPAWLNISSASADVVAFTVTYPIITSRVGVTRVVETVTLTDSKITIGSTVNGGVDSVTFNYPVFLWDGIYNTTYSIAGNKVVMSNGIPETFSVESPAGVTLAYQDLQVRSRNGFLGAATATVPATNDTQYVISIEHCAGCPTTKTFTVGASGADFTTIGAAIDAARALGGAYAYSIAIQTGTYAEKVVVDVPNGVLRASSTPVVITYQTTSDTDASLSITAANVRVYGLTILSTASVGNALSINPSSASQTSFYECSFYGFRDTVNFRNSFVLAYFKKSYIEGGADMITGSGSVYFDECTLASNGAGSVTAMSGISASNTDQWVFNYVTLVATVPSAPIASFANPSFAYTNSSQFAGSNFLGRPADAFSRVTFMYNNLGSHINVKGWTAAGYFFAEFQNVGPSAFTPTRDASAQLLSGDQAGVLSLVGVLGGLPIILPQWIDRNYLPNCAAIYGMCYQGAVTVPRCCQAGLACIKQTDDLSQCQYIPLSPRTNGSARVFQSSTFGLEVIYVNNPWGPVTFSYNSTDLNAYFDAILSNAVAESVLTGVTRQMTPTPALNITISYSSFSDPRGIALGLHITLPTGNQIRVINITPGSTSPPTVTPNPGTSAPGTPAPTTTASPTTSSPFSPTGYFVNSAPALSALLGLIVTCVVLLL